jgi:hypothetical protein
VRPGHGHTFVSEYLVVSLGREKLVSLLARMAVLSWRQRTFWYSHRRDLTPMSRHGMV